MSFDLVKLHKQEIDRDRERNKCKKNENEMLILVRSWVTLSENCNKFLTKNDSTKSSSKLICELWENQ